ncbi:MULTISPECIES: amino acid adenylation domain-containing protein [unclassified Streptomyces]|uniref:non-ribosomal peptide synthetase n=1 Tax=unclassified Streptomyces TaxID=2593676 RepID=UPI003818564B
MSEARGIDESVCVHERIEECARRLPDLVALEDGEITYTYRALNERANRLARLLVARGIGLGDRVGIRMSRSADFVVAAFAILKTGAAYVPMEVGVAESRTRVMAEENRMALALVTGDTNLGVPGCGVLNLGGLDDALAVQSPNNLGERVVSDDIMYVPYTSGSTGTPKGIEVPHRALAGFFRGEDYAYWGPGAVTVHHSSASWDGHLIDLYPALLSGGKVIVHRGDSTDPISVAQLAAERGATVMLLTSAAFNAIVDIDISLLRGLRYLVVGGEALSRAHVSAALRALPDTRIINGYGPSECTVLSSIHRIESGDCDRELGIPIGRAVGDRMLYIVDADLQPVPDGTQGELCVGGPAVAQGYLARPALTAERFAPDPFSGELGARIYRTGDLARRATDGRLEFVGRSDDQVKIRGLRIEPGEVTERLRRLPAVRDAVVTPRRDENGNCVELIAHIVRSGATMTRKDLRQALAIDLPQAMVPGAFVLMDRFPLTANGKVDKQELPAPGLEDRDDEIVYVAPRSATEAFLAEVWSALLDIAEVGRDHNFFVLGGQSLLAVRMAGRVRQEYGIEITLRSVYEAPLLWQVAAEIDRRRADTEPANFEEIAAAPRRTRQRRSAR